jgi:putative NADPH-quinone reductase
MKVLLVYAHYNPDLFTHALLKEVTRGLEDGGRDVGVNDLQARGFNPVFKLDDSVHAAASVSDERRREYLKEAYGLGREF